MVIIMHCDDVWAPLLIGHVQQNCGTCVFFILIHIVQLSSDVSGAKTVHQDTKKKSSSAACGRNLYFSISLAGFFSGWKVKFINMWEFIIEHFAIEPTRTRDSGRGKIIAYWIALDALWMSSVAVVFKCSLYGRRHQSFSEKAHNCESGTAVAGSAVG